MPCKALVNNAFVDSAITGQPLEPTLPPTVGQASFLSATPSLSPSGQPPTEPFTVGQASLLSTKPSPSVSGSEGHPLSVPATSGQASSLSATPSPSPSGQPLIVPATVGQASLPVSYTHLTLPTIYSV